MDVTPSTATSNAVARLQSRRLVVMLWSILAVVLVVKTALAPGKHSTFPCFEAGTACWFLDVNPYDFSQSHQEYRYTPTFAVAFTPFAALPSPLGACAWAVFNVALLWYALDQLIAWVLPGRWTAAMVVAYHALVMLAAVRGLWSAQTNMFIVSLVALGAAAIIRQRWTNAATWLALPVFIKLWPIVAAALFAACWPKRLIPRGAAVLVLLAALPWTSRPLEIVWHQHANFLEAISGPIQERHIYRDAWTVWELLAPVDPDRYRVLQLASGLATLVLCLGVRERQLGPQREATLILGLWTVWQLLFGPGVERNTLCLIAPVASWVVLAQGQNRIGTALAWAGFLLVTVFSFGVFERLLLPVTPLVLAALPAGVLLIGVWLAFCMPVDGMEQPAIAAEPAIAPARARAA